MIYPNKKFVSEIADLIKNLLTFCKFNVSVKRMKFPYYALRMTVKKLFYFLKDNPSFNLDTLIDITAIDYPNETKRFTVVYNLLSVTKNFRIKIKLKVSEQESVPSNM